MVIANEKRTKNYVQYIFIKRKCPKCGYHWAWNIKMEDLNVVSADIHIVLKMFGILLGYLK
jgi:hypothetical protein